MEENKKRIKRSSNFTKVEEMLLVEEVEKLKNVIECKITDKVNNYDKSQAWIKVTAQFNAKGPSQQARSMEQLKAKYENLKTKARKYAADNKKYLQATGGGPSHDPDWDPVIEAILRVMNEKTVIGFQNPNDSDAVDNPTDEVMNIEVINQEGEYEELIVLMEGTDKENASPIAVEDFDAIQSTTKMSKVEVIDTKNKEADIQTSFATDWSRYTPKQLRTPVNQKLRQKVPVSNSLQIAKEEYYRNKNILMGEEIKLKKMDEEDRQRKRMRDEEEHEIKMKILRVELKLNEKELNVK